MYLHIGKLDNLSIYVVGSCYLEQQKSNQWDGNFCKRVFEQRFNITRFLGK